MSSDKNPADCTPGTYAEAVKMLDDFAKDWHIACGHPLRKKGFKRFGLFPMKQKPLSPRRAREFRDRHCKRLFGDRRERAMRFRALVKLACLARDNGTPVAPWLSKLAKYGRPAERRGSK